MSKSRQARVPMVEQMDDETFISHLETRHAQDLALEFKAQPGREEEPRRMMTRIAWETYHHLLHQWALRDGVELDHFHDYPLIAKTARPTNPRIGMVIRDKQSQGLFTWDGHQWAKLQEEIGAAPQRLALPSSK